MDYVLGFRFRGVPAIRQVALILKNKPNWQAGKLNGIGGKVETFDYVAGQSAAAVAMAREFKEETGLDVPVEDWRQFGTLRHAGNTIYLFASEGDGEIESTTAEQVGWYAVSLLNLMPIMPNLAWMVPMAQDKDRVTAEILDPSEVPA